MFTTTTTPTTNATNNQTPRVVRGFAPAATAQAMPKHRDDGRAWSLVAGLVGYMGTLAFGMVSLGVLAAVMH